MKILLDNGHGVDTPGKRSPIWKDGSQLFEYEFNRDIVNRIAKGLSSLGIPFAVLVPEIKDISLPKRCTRVNTYASKEKCLLISVHANAGGGNGFEVYTTIGKTKSDGYASIIAEEFQKEFPTMKLRTDMSDGDVDKESQFYILKNVACPAVLTENLFMDNEADCIVLMSEKGRMKIAQYHINAIKRIHDGSTLG